MFKGTMNFANEAGMRGVRMKVTVKLGLFIVAVSTLFGH
jgi:hypothetical protein